MAAPRKTYYGIKDGKVVSVRRITCPPGFRLDKRDIKPCLSDSPEPLIDPIITKLQLEVERLKAELKEKNKIKIRDREEFEIEKTYSNARILEKSNEHKMFALKQENQGLKLRLQEIDRLKAEYELLQSQYGIFRADKIATIRKLIKSAWHGPIFLQELEKIHNDMIKVIPTDPPNKFKEKLDTSIQKFSRGIKVIEWNKLIVQYGLLDQDLSKAE